MSEYTRLVDVRHLTEAPLVIEPDADARRRLAARFGIVAIEAMRAEVQLTREGAAVTAEGRLVADIVQACAISAEDFPVHIDEPVALRFVPAGELAAEPDEEIELTAEDCDEIPYEGTTFDLGEAIAQSLALAIDPFAEGPGADEARRAHGLDDPGAAGPFAALAALRPKG